MEKSPERIEKEARLEEYNKTYADQLRLQRYIDALERDNESIRDAEVFTNRGKRRQKKLIKINDKDISLYKKMLRTLPEPPPFK
ncbi:MAG: hypothetical protein FWH17_03240 [Oscillospiraceae bacterium]|nr:hypothetical protein [Oscillospiraceae bacterium]